MGYRWIVRFRFPGEHPLGGRLGGCDHHGDRSCRPDDRGVGWMRNEEAKIQADIVRYLSSEGVFCHSVPNEGAGTDKMRTMRMITMGLRPGTADLVVWLPWH